MQGSTSPQQQILLCVDGEWHIVADAAVRASFPRSSRHSSAGVSSVGVRRAPGQADGASRFHC